MVTWGVVQSVTVGAVTVRLAGDTVDVPIALQPDAVTLATSDKVAVAKLGGSWTIVAVLEDA